MNAADVMARRIIGIAPDATIDEAAEIMLDEGVSGLSVMEHGRLVGIITETDLLRRVELGTEIKRSWWLRLFASPGQLSEEYSHARGRRVHEVMTKDVLAVEEDTPLDEIVDLMTSHQVKRIPVLAKGYPVGMVTRSDLVRALAIKLRRGAKHCPRVDADIAKDIEDELERRTFLPQSIAVSVKASEVYLSGAIFDERERTALRVLAENVEGVTRVHDRLRWVDPMPAIAVY